jgi:hypothetical protein
MNEFGLLPSWMKGFIDQQYSGHITIVPDVNLRVSAPLPWSISTTVLNDIIFAQDFRIVLANPTRAAIDYWIFKGEQAVWSKLSLIKNRCAIEFALDR